MREGQPAKVETLLETLNLSHLMEGTQVSHGSQTVPNKAKIVWTADMETPSSTSQVVRPMFRNSIKRRLFHSHNQLRFEDWETAESPLVSLKPDRLRPVHNPHLSQGHNSPTPNWLRQPRDLETVIPPHKRNTGVRTSLSGQKSRTQQLHYIHLYRFIQLNTVDTKGNGKTESCSLVQRPASRDTPDQMLASDYQSPYCLYLKGRKATAQQKRMGYSLPNPKRITAEIKRLQAEKDRKFDSIIEQVVQEFSLPR